MVVNNEGAINNTYPRIISIEDVEAVPWRAVAGHLHIFTQTYRELCVTQLEQVRVGAILVATATKNTG